VLTITEADIKKFTPKARPEYVMAIIGNLYQLRTAGILDNSFRLSHFMAQIAHETGGLTIIRENMNYSVKRMRQVWPARFRDKPDAELQPLAKDARKLADAVYLGRMGNNQPGDGYDYRGGGFLQTTGRSAVAKYCKALGLEPSPSLLDDPATTLQFACLEWTQSKCNDPADANDLMSVSKAINVGSAASGVTPVGMSSRQEWFAKAWSIWGEKGKPDTEPKVAIGFLGGNLKFGLPSGIAAGTLVPAVPAAYTEAVQNLGAWKGLLMQVGSLGSEAAVAGGSGLAAAAGVYLYARKWFGAA
jgi:putative chitinase